MKQILLVLLLITGINSAHAQSNSNHAIYFANEFNLGNYFGADVGMNYVYSEKYSVKAGYNANLRLAKSTPYDYSSGLVGAYLFGLAEPMDQLENYHLAIGQIYKLNKSGTIRVNFALGLGLTTIKEPKNWQRENRAFLVENYTWNYKKYNTLSLIVNPKIEFPFSRFYGFTVSPMIQINKDRIYLGIGIGQMIGILRKRKEPASND